MQVHQVLVAASPGDAITNEALALRSLLSRVTRSEIFARYVDPRLAGTVHPLHQFGASSMSWGRQDILVFHASIGEPSVLSFLLDRPERVVLLYHNISPSSSFQPYDPRFAGLLEDGRSELRLLKDKVALALAVSEFNASQLRAMGYRDVRVSPLVVDVDRLASLDPDPGTAHHLATQVPGRVLLFVGQLLPHKRPDFLIEAYHILVTYLVPDVHLALVGAPRLPRYATALQELIAELNLHRAFITGAVSDAELAAYYRRADLFVTASEHEGFCVPVLEAMAFGCPVLARGAAAIPETAGDAALLLPPADGPATFAEAMALVLSDAGTRDVLRARGDRRLERFDVDHAGAVFLNHLLELA